MKEIRKENLVKFSWHILLFCFIILPVILSDQSIILNNDNKPIYEENNIGSDIYPRAQNVNIPLPSPTFYGYNVTEFNDTSTHPEKYQVIYQYGYSEVAAFYSVSGDSILNYSTHHTTGFNLTLPDEYYKMWNLKYVDFFNLTSIIREEDTEYYVESPLGNTSEDLPGRIELNSVGENIREYKTKYMNITGIRLHFSYLHLQSGDSIKIYNSSFDVEQPPALSLEPDEEIFGPNYIGSEGWTDWINTSSAHVVLESTSDFESAYEIDMIEYKGITFNYTAGDQLLIQVNPDILGFKIQLKNLNLSTGAYLKISDATGEHEVIFDETNSSMVNDDDGWTSDWMMPDYCVLNFTVGDSADYELNNVTILKIEYNSTKGWQRVYSPEFYDFIDYTPYNQHVIVNFTKLAGEDPRQLYSSWSFVFNKTRLNTTMELFKLNGANAEKQEGYNKSIILYDTAYNISFTVRDAKYGNNVDDLNLPSNYGTPNPVSIEVWQNNMLKYFTNSTISGGKLNFTITSSFAHDNDIHAGEFMIKISINDTNYAALDNTTANANYTFYYYEKPSLTVNSVESEYFGKKDIIPSELTTTAGTIFDPNKITFNITVSDMYGVNTTMDGQPINVTVYYNGSQYDSTYIYQSYHPEVNHSFALFSYSFDKIGDWNVSFTLENSSNGKPDGFFLATEPIMLNISAVARDFDMNLTVSNGEIRLGHINTLYTTVYDTEETDKTGEIFGLNNWTVKFYYMRFIGNKFEKFYIGTDVTNGSGIATVEWTPEISLAGEEIYLYSEAYTPDGELIRFIGNQSLLRSGFDIAPINTYIEVSHSSEIYYYDDSLDFSINLIDEFNRTLLGETVEMQLEAVYNTTFTESYNYTFVIGQNNTNFIFTPTYNLTGVIRYTLSYSGNDNYHESTYTAEIDFHKKATHIQIYIAPQGYDLAASSIIPINVLILDNVSNGIFFDEGSLHIEIKDHSHTIVKSEDKYFHGYSNISIDDWSVNGGDYFFINITYSGGQYHNGSDSVIGQLIDRSDVELSLSAESLFAGDPLVLHAIVRYEKNQTGLGHRNVLFEFVDRMGNAYILGIAQTDSSGTATLTYEYDENDYVYLNMIEFGGDLYAVSEMDSRHKSGFDYIYDFQIQKTKTNISITTNKDYIDPGETLLITLNLTSQTGLSMIGETVDIEIWSDSNYEPLIMNKTMENESITFTFTPYTKGRYFIKALYKGSHIFEASSGVKVFYCGVEPEYETTGAKSSLHITPEDSSKIVLLQILSISALVGGYYGYKKLDHRNKRRVLGILGILMFVGGEVSTGFIMSGSVPYNEKILNDFNINVVSDYEWLGDSHITADQLSAYLDQMGFNDKLLENSSLDEMAQMAQVLYGGENRGLLALMQQLGLVSPSYYNPQSAGDDAGMSEVQLGGFGTMPYPIGDMLNISFTTTQDCYYLLAITDRNLNRRIYTIYGESSQNENQRIQIPISSEKFNVGGEYALEIYVYKQGVTEYMARDMRRMTFNVVKGFSQLHAAIDNVTIGEHGKINVTLTEQYSNDPLGGRSLTVLYFDRDINDFKYYTTAVTDAQGKISIDLPTTDYKGDVPLRIIFNGDSDHYSSEIDVSYEVYAIPTVIKLYTNSTQYSDATSLKARLLDIYGNPLSGKNLFYTIHLYNTTIGQFNDIPMDDVWQNLGNVTTDEDGYAEMNLTAYYPAGNYEIKVIFQGDDTYNSSQSTKVALSVEREGLTVDFINTTLFYGSEGILSIKMYDDEGNPAAAVPVTFRAYYNHKWYDLGNTKTKGSGWASINTTVYWNEGDYLLGVIKNSDKRFVDIIEYGTLHVRATNTSLSLGLNAGEYLKQITLTAKLEVMNGSDLQPLANEPVFFYIMYDMPDGSTDPIFAGTGITNEAGLAEINWNATLPPDTYTVKAMFPGNSFADPITVFARGLVILKGTVRIQQHVPAQSAVMDYADFSYNVTDIYNEPIIGAPINIKIFNETNYNDTVLSTVVYTDKDGLAYFRWVPGTTGNYTVLSYISSPYYRSQNATSRINIIRKGVIFNVTMNSLRFYRGDLCSLVGNTSIKYKYYNGSEEIIPAGAVPLKFQIWNESLFVHPISGFMVPNYPIKNLDGEYITYSDSSQEHCGLFHWSFIMPDAAHGLQAGRYFLKIMVDTTKTGLYTGETLISFDLVEHTSMEIWVEPSERVHYRQYTTHEIPEDTDYFVNETERVHIKLIDQDGVGLMKRNYEKPTYRDLLIKMGHERTLYFHVAPDNTPSLYLGDSIYGENITEISQPKFDINTGNYSFNYVPYYAGSSDIYAQFFGDRFFDANSYTFERTVYHRPTYLTTRISRTDNLYRKNTDKDYVWKNTTIYANIVDVISGDPISKKRIEYYFDDMLMQAPKFGLAPNYTDAYGNVEDLYWIDNWIQAGVHKLYILSPQDRVYAENMSKIYDIKIWETTSTSVEFKRDRDQLYRVIVKVWDQDNQPLTDAQFAVSISGNVKNQGKIGGAARGLFSGVAVGGTGEYLWDPNDLGFESGPLTIVVDFLGDENRAFRASSSLYSANLYISGSSFGSGYTDTLYYAGISGGLIPYTAYIRTNPLQIYYNIQELRKVPNVNINDIMVNTFDGFGYKTAKSCYYVWIKNIDKLHYTPKFNGRLPAIIAFKEEYNARQFADNLKMFNARLIPWDAVFNNGGTPPSANVPRAASADSSNNRAILTVERRENPINKLISMLKGMDANMELDGQPSTASDPSAAGGETTSKRIAIAQYFGTVAGLMEDSGIKWIYSMIFKILEVSISGGYKVRTSGGNYEWTSVNSELDDLTINFESDSDVSQHVVSESPNLKTSFGSSGDEKYLLIKPEGNTVGDDFYISVDQNEELSQASAIGFSLKSGGSKSDTYNTIGIDVILEDSDGNRISTTMKVMDFDCYEDFVDVEIPVGDFEGDDNFEMGNLAKIYFEVKDGGFITDEDLKIASVSFYETKYAYEWQDASREVEDVSIGSWLIQELILNLLVKPLYEALSKAFEEVLGDVAGKFISLDAFIDLISAFGLLIFDEDFSWKDFAYCLWSLVISSVQDAGNSYLDDKFSKAVTNETDDDSPPPGVAPGYNFNELNKTGKFLRILKFVFAGWVSGIAFNVIPGYFFELDGTWEDVVKAGDSPIQSIKYGFGRMKWSHELLLTMAAIFIGSIKYFFSLIKNDTARRVLTSLLDAGWNFFLKVFNFGLSAGDRKVSGGKTTRESVSLFTPEKMTKKALGTLMSHMLVDLVIDMLLSLIDMPDWLSWLLDKIVRLIAKLILSIVLWPAESGTIPIKVLTATTLGLIVSELVAPQFLYICGAGQSFMDPFGGVAGMVLDGEFL